MTKENKKRLILLGIVVVFIAIYLLVPQVNSSINSAMAAFGKGFDGVFAYIKNFADENMALAITISFLLMIMASILSPIPQFFVTLSNAAIYGFAVGVIVSWTSAMLGAAICFYIGRILGRDIVEKLATKEGVKNIEEFFMKHGSKAIFVGRLLPFIPFDAVSYVAGLTPITFGKFFLATGIGQTPATIAYSYFAKDLSNARTLMWGLIGLFGLAFLSYLLRVWYGKRQKKKIFKIILIVIISIISIFLIRTINVNNLRNFVESSGEAADLVYVLSWVILPIFLFPVPIIAFVGGALFGLFKGTILTLIGASINASIMLYISRYLAKDLINEYIFSKIKNEKLKKNLKTDNQKALFTIFIILRFTPLVSFNAENYLAGLTNIKLSTHIIETLIGVLPGTIIFLNVGDKIIGNSIPAIVIAIVLLIILAIVPTFVGKKYFKEEIDKDK